MKSTYVTSNLFVFLGGKGDEWNETYGEPGPSSDASC